MNLWQLDIYIILKQDLNIKDMYYKLSQVINRAMLKDDKLRLFHEANTYKMYSFSGLFPAVKGEEYKKGAMYSFALRSLDKGFIMSMQKYIKETENDLFKVLNIIISAKKQSVITELYTLTPTVATFESEDRSLKYWIKNNYSTEEIVDRINRNLLKKYAYWNGKEVDSSFNLIQDIEQVNDKAIAINYKNGKRFLGNKFRLKVKQDKLSQELAFMALASGILEKNSLGLGFCISKGAA